MSITENPYVMIDEFRSEIANRNIILDEEDLRVLKDIISITGTNLDIRDLAKSIKEYVEKIASLFNNA